MRRKDQESIRICFQNTNGIPLINAHHKNESIYSFLANNNVDTFGMSEVNINWKLLPIDQRWSARTLSWFNNSRTTFSYLAEDKFSERYQIGGTGIMNIGGITRRFVEKGIDSNGLGRWAWCKYRGKRNQSIRIISIYAPTFNNENSGSVYSQQRRVMLDRNDDRCPVKAFWEDLWIELGRWTEEGDIIIVGGDFNEDIYKPELIQKFKNLGMVNGLHRMHPSLFPINTHKEGSRTIDGIFISESVEIFKCGYLNFDEGIPSDHRPVWADIKIKELFDRKYPSNPISNPRRLTLQDPRVVRKYTQDLKDYMRIHKIKEKVIELRNTVTNPMSQQDIDKFEALDKLRTQGLKQAERKCRKLKMGHTPWSPELSEARKAIVYWQLSLRQKSNKKVNIKKIIRLAKTLKIIHDKSWSKEYLKEKKDEAIKGWKKLVENAEKIREKWLEDLSDQLEDQGKGKKETILRNLIFRERQRHCHRRLRYILKKTHQEE